MAQTNILGIANNLPLQPKLTNLFTLKIDGARVPGQVAGDVALVKMQIDLMECSRPSTSFNAVTMTRINQKYQVAGSPNPDMTLAMKFRDTIQGNVSRVLWNWSQVIYNPKTGQFGYANTYKTDATLVILDPMGKQIETYSIKGMWPSKIEYGSALVYSDSPTASEVSVTMSYDIAWLNNTYNEVNPVNRILTNDNTDILSPNFIKTTTDNNFDQNHQVPIQDLKS